MDELDKYADIDQYVDIIYDQDQTKIVPIIINENKLKIFNICTNTHELVQLCTEESIKQNNLNFIKQILATSSDYQRRMMIYFCIKYNRHEIFKFIHDTSQIAIDVSQIRAILRKNRNELLNACFDGLIDVNAKSYYNGYIGNEQYEIMPVFDQQHSLKGIIEGGHTEIYKKLIKVFRNNPFYLYPTILIHANAEIFLDLLPKLLSGGCAGGATNESYVAITFLNDNPDIISIIDQFINLKKVEWIGVFNNLVNTKERIKPCWLKIIIDNIIWQKSSISNPSLVEFISNLFVDEKDDIDYAKQILDALVPLINIVGIEYGLGNNKFIDNSKVLIIQDDHFSDNKELMLYLITIVPNIPIKQNYLTIDDVIYLVNKGVSQDNFRYVYLESTGAYNQIVKHQFIKSRIKTFLTDYFIIDIFDIIYEYWRPFQRD